VDVIDVAFQVSVAADGVLPIATLPDAFSRFDILLSERDWAGVKKNAPASFWCGDRETRG
jgi:hypothetical protein